MLKNILTVLRKLASAAMNFLSLIHILTQTDVAVVKPCAALLDDAQLDTRCV